jgi:hypothetical protein
MAIIHWRTATTGERGRGFDRAGASTALNGSRREDRSRSAQRLGALVAESLLILSRHIG